MNEKKIAVTANSDDKCEIKKKKNSEHRNILIEKAKTLWKNGKINHNQLKNIIGVNICWYTYTRLNIYIVCVRLSFVCRGFENYINNEHTVYIDSINVRPYYSIINCISMWCLYYLLGNNKPNKFRFTLSGIMQLR